MCCHMTEIPRLGEVEARFGYHQRRKKKKAKTTTTKTKPQTTTVSKQTHK